MNQRRDILVENCGSIFLLRPLTDEAADWLLDHTADDAMFMGDALAVEPRFVEAIVVGAQEDGLVV